MSVTMIIFVNIFSIFLLLCGLYLLARVFIPVLAEKDTFFSSPKLGRIKARKRSGRIVGFFDNLVHKGKHVNTQTGKVENGEIIKNDFFWKYFGAYFIGLDDVYTYKIATGAIEENGVLKYTEDEASSIFLEGSYPLTTMLVSKEGVNLKVKFQLKLTTVDAAKALSLPVSWTIPVFASVIGTCRDYFGARDMKTIISAQKEASGENNSEFVNQIINLNTPKKGNVSLAEICGQRIDAVNLIEVDFADEETKKAFSAPFIAEQEAQIQVKEAEAYASAIQIRAHADMLAAEKIASTITLKGNAEARVYSKKCAGLGGDSQAAAQVLVAERHSTMSNLNILVQGANPGINIPISKKEEEK